MVPFAADPSPPESTGHIIEDEGPSMVAFSSHFAEQLAPVSELKAEPSSASSPTSPTKKIKGGDLNGEASRPVGEPSTETSAPTADQPTEPRPHFLTTESHLDISTSGAHATDRRYTILMGEVSAAASFRPTLRQHPQTPADIEDHARVSLKMAEAADVRNGLEPDWAVTRPEPPVPSSKSSWGNGMFIGASCEVQDDPPDVVALLIAEAETRQEQEDEQASQDGASSWNEPEQMGGQEQEILHRWRVEKEARNQVKHEVSYQRAQRSRQQAKDEELRRRSVEDLLRREAEAKLAHRRKNALMQKTQEDDARRQAEEELWKPPVDPCRWGTSPALSEEEEGEDSPCSTVHTDAASVSADLPQSPPTPVWKPGPRASQLQAASPSRPPSCVKHSGVTPSVSATGRSLGQTVMGPTCGVAAGLCVLGIVVLFWRRQGQNWSTSHPTT